MLELLTPSQIYSRDSGKYATNSKYYANYKERINKASKLAI